MISIATKYYLLDKENRELKKENTELKEKFLVSDLQRLKSYCESRELSCCNCSIARFEIDIFVCPLLEKAPMSWDVDSILEKLNTESECMKVKE